MRHSPSTRLAGLAVVLLAALSNLPCLTPAPAAADPVARFLAGSGRTDTIDVVHLDRPETYVVTEPVLPIIRRWLSAYHLEGALDRGEFTVEVGDRVINGDGSEAGGMFVDGRILISATRGWCPLVLAHEIGHWLQARDVTVRQEGLATAIPAFERDADVIASVLLAGVAGADGGTTDATPAEVALAVQVIKGVPLSVKVTGPSTAEDLAAGRDPYTVRDPQSPAVSEADLLSARADAGIDAAGPPAT